MDRVDNSLLLPILLLCPVALLIAAVLTEICRHVALRTGLVDNPDAARFHKTPTPYGGGVAIVLTTLGMTLGGWAALTHAPWETIHPELAQTLAPLAKAMQFQENLLKLGAVLGGGLLLFALGLWDDCKGLSPKTKLLVQAGAAGLLVTADVRMTVFVQHYAVSAVVTILWVVLITNALNLLDNMDGLSGGVSAISALLFCVIAIQNGQILVAAMLAVFAGAALGFLTHNFPPARLFMGDAGSLFCGWWLGSMTVAGTYYPGQGGVYAVCMPLLILAVPLFDTTSVLLLRWRRGKPLFVGDTNHLSHRLVRLGMTTREAILTIYLLCLLLGGAATLLAQVDATGAWIILGLGAGIITLLVLLETAAARQDASANDKTKDS